jgi:hypothetical protein
VNRALLCRFATADNRGVRADLLQRFRNAGLVSRPTEAQNSRTGAALLDQAERARAPDREARGETLHQSKELCEA